MFSKNCFPDEVVVWGLGINSIKFTYFLEKRNIKVKYYLVNDRKIDTFCNRPVYELSERKESLKEYIFVATSEDVYSIISSQLASLGLNEFENYIYWQWTYKKLIFLHGNCHMGIIKEFLLSSKEFNEKYAFYPNPPIWLIKDYKINKRIFKYIDVWIHQYIRNENKYGYYVSDEYARKCIAEYNRVGQIQEITLPNLYNLGQGFFPQIIKDNVNNEEIIEKDGGFFPLGDVIIDRCMEEGKSDLEIVDYYKGEVFSKEEIQELFNLCLDKIKDREKKWDIKIYDYIKENYKKEKLFFDPYHPTNSILKKICIDILDVLNIRDNNIVCERALNICEIPILPYVKNVLDLKYDISSVRKGKFAKKLTESMHLEEYVMQYIWWCYKRDIN